jgi:flagellar biosynthesis protein
MIYKNFRGHSSKNKKELTRAAVIRYDKDRDSSPVVVAQGRGEVARKIIEKAKENDITLQEDPLLLESLLSLDLGNQVPPQLYQVVAEILLLVRRANTGESVPAVLAPRASSVRHTSYWEEDQDEEDVSLDDLLVAINNIQ